MNNTTALVAATTLLLTSCASLQSTMPSLFGYPAVAACQNPDLNKPPSSTELESAEYGAAPARGFRDAIASAFGTTLRDPESARYQFAEPERSWLPRYHFDKPAPTGQAYKSGHVFGWAVHFTANAKNAFGGYVGAEPLRAFFQGGSLVAILRPSQHLDIFGYTNDFLVVRMRGAEAQ